jgi:AcrR family transcriptional regulator
MSDAMDPEVRAEIGDAVRRALVDHGYERVTTAKIAEAYGKTEAGLYYYFDSKDEMIAAFLDHLCGHLSEQIAGRETDGPEDELRVACELLFLDPDDEAAPVHVAIMELLSHAPHNETLREPLIRLETAVLEELERIVREGVEAGVFRAVDPRATAAFLLAAADGSTGFYTALEMDVGADVDRGVAAYVDSLLAEQP